MSPRARPRFRPFPRLLVAGPWSSTGKTTVATGIMAALTRQGHRVQGFKAGPDYIDPTFHTLATGRPSRNLDGWLLPPSINHRLFQGAAADADISILEGVMGLYDSMGGPDRTSTAWLARLLRCPVVLVVDAGKMARSLGAIALGYRKFDPRIHLAGAILNRVAGERHALLCEEGLRQAGVPMLGWLPRDESIRLEERHLGLVPTHERKTDVQRIGRFIETHLDTNLLLRLARRAPPLPPVPPRPRGKRRESPVVGVALDPALNFYYRDGLQALEEAGARLRYFSPLQDKEVEADGIYLGGGFPELFAARLSRNTPMLRRIRQMSEEGRPIYGECGGLMLLGRRLRDLRGRSHPMAGALDVETRMEKRLTLGYTRLQLQRTTPIGPRGSELRGHEFHYSQAQAPRDARYAYRLLRGRGISEGRDGLHQENTLAGYTHLHFAGCPRAARRFVDECERARRNHSQRV